MLSDSFYLNKQSYLQKDLLLRNTGGVQSIIFLKLKHSLFSLLYPSPVLPLFKISMQCPSRNTRPPMTSLIIISVLPVLQVVS